MKLRKSGQNGNRTLTMSGELTVGYAAKLKRALTEELEHTDSLRLRFGDVEDADITLIQLLCAAHRSAHKRNKTVAVYGKGIPQAIWDTAWSVGMFGSLRCMASGTCIYEDERSIAEGGAL